MLFKALAFTLLLSPSVGHAFDASAHIDLGQCWGGGDISDELWCMEEQLWQCEGVVDELGLGTANGLYSCSHEVFSQVDQRLNELYPSLVTQVRFLDNGMPPENNEELLREAQRNWVSYRDTMCELKPTLGRTNSGYDAVVAECAAELTVMQIHTLLRYVP